MFAVPVLFVLRLTELKVELVNAAAEWAGF
jgi:hypothetical protein